MGFRELTAADRAQKTVMPEKTAETGPSVSSKPPHKKPKMEFPNLLNRFAQLRARSRQTTSQGFGAGSSTRRSLACFSTATCEYSMGKYRVCSQSGTRSE